MESHEGRFDPDETLRKQVEKRFGGGLAMEYTHWIEEQKAWRQSCALTNMSYMLYLHVEGPDALDLFADHSINRFDGFDVGTAKHAVQCNRDGQVISEGLLLRLEDDEFVTQGFPAAYLRHRQREGGYDCVTELRGTNVYEVEGPNALPVMESVTTASLREIGFMNFTEIEIAGRDVIALRHGMSGDIGFELHVHEDDADAVRDRIVEAGREYDLRQVGLRAATTKRFESGQPQGNLDYLPALFSDRVPEAFSVSGSFDADDVSGWYRTPVELGWGRYVDFDHEFVGRDALEAEVADPDRTLVTLVWDDQDVVDVYASLFEDGETRKFIKMPDKGTSGVTADEVRADGDLIGLSSQPGYMYYFREMLSLCSIDVGYSDPGTKVTIVWGEGGDVRNPMVESPHARTEISATVAPAPYADENRRSSLDTGTVN